jgi:hypothetical protein
MLHGIGQTALWFAAGLAILQVATGAVTLGRRQVVLPWLRGRVRWQRWGWGMVTYGAFLLLESVPRLAGWSDESVLVLSGAALLPLLVGVVLQQGAWLPRT